MRKDLRDKIEVVIVTVHGIESYGKNLEALSVYLMKQEFNPETTRYRNIVYGRVQTWINRFPIVRDLIADHVALNLKILKLKHPNAKIILIAHSNGTWASARAIEIYYKYFRLDLLILLGCVMKRKFDWRKYRDIKVINFIGIKDKVVWLAKPFYAMGWAGRYGFKQEAPNLRQIKKKWRHTGFVKHFDLIRDEIEHYLERQ